MHATGLRDNTEEMSKALKTAQARFLMTTPRPMEVAAASAKEAGILKQNLFLLEGELPGYKNWEEIWRIGSSSSVQTSTKKKE